MREWTKPVPPEWQDALERVSGQARSDRVPWLKLVWEPGEAWEPVERWVIYEMIPRARLLSHRAGREQAEAILADLAGPPPVSRRSWKVKDGRRVLSTTCFVTQREWELYRTTGCYGRPYWVLQGDHGGHKKWFNPVEQRLLRLAGRPSEPPDLGDLPYAGWDRRVEDALARERALLEEQTLVRNLERRTDADWRAEMRRREKGLAKLLLAHLDQQLAAAVDEVKYSWAPSDLPEGAPITDEDMEQAEAEFLSESVTPE